MSWTQDNWLQYLLPGGDLHSMKCTFSHILGMRYWGRAFAPSPVYLLQEKQQWNREDVVIRQVVCNQNVGGRQSYAETLENRNQHGTHFLSASEISFLKLDVHFILFPAFIKQGRAAMNGVLLRATPLFFLCDGLSFGCGLPGTACSTLTAWEVKPAWSLAFTRGSVCLPHLLHLL